MSDSDDPTRLMPTPYLRLASIRAQTRPKEQLTQATPLISIAPSSAIPSVGVKGAGETYFGDTIVAAFPESDAALVADCGQKSKDPARPAVVVSANLARKEWSARLSLLLDALRAAKERVVSSKHSRTTKVALGALGFLLGITLAVALSPDDSETTSAQGTASHPVSVDITNAEKQLPFAPALSNLMPATESGRIDEQHQASPVTLYAMTGKHVTKAKRALLATISGKCEPALALYRELLSQDEGNRALYVSLLAEVERRCSKRKDQP